MEHIKRFSVEHADSRAKLLNWTRTVRDQQWKTTADVRATFAKADFVAGKVVFDIGGGKYRLIATIDFRATMVRVTHVLTHREYEKEKWK